MFGLFGNCIAAVLWAVLAYVEAFLRPFSGSVGAAGPVWVCLGLSWGCFGAVLKMY